MKRTAIDFLTTLGLRKKRTLGTRLMEMNKTRALLYSGLAVGALFGLRKRFM
jgi:hypothetical protein